MIPTLKFRADFRADNVSSYPHLQLFFTIIFNNNLPGWSDFVQQLVGKILIQPGLTICCCLTLY